MTKNGQKVPMITGMSQPAYSLSQLKPMAMTWPTMLPSGPAMTRPTMPVRIIVTMGARNTLSALGEYLLATGSILDWTHTMSRMGMTLLA